MYGYCRLLYHNVIKYYSYHNNDLNHIKSIKRSSEPLQWCHVWGVYAALMPLCVSSSLSFSLSLCAPLWLVTPHESAPSPPCGSERIASLGRLAIKYCLIISLICLSDVIYVLLQGQSSWRNPGLRGVLKGSSSRLNI